MNLISRIICSVALLGSSSCSSSRPPLQVAVDLEVPRVAGGNTASPESGVAFGRIPPKVGSKWRVEVVAKSAATVPDPGGPQTQVSEYESAYTAEILAVDGPAPSRVRLVFEKNVNTFQGTPKSTSLEGKTYLVEATSPHVRTPAGTEPPSEETQRVLDIFPELGTRTQIDQVLPDRPMAIGETREELAGAILQALHPRAWKLHTGSATLARVERGEAVFLIAFDTTGQNAVRMDVKGEARIRQSDARLTLIALEGTYIGEAQVTGTVTIRRTLTE